MSKELFEFQTETSTTNDNWQDVFWDDCVCRSDDSAVESWMPKLSGKGGSFRAIELGRRMMISLSWSSQQQSALHRVL